MCRYTHLGKLSLCLPPSLETMSEMTPMTYWTMTSAEATVALAAGRTSGLLDSRMAYLAQRRI